MEKNGLCKVVAWVDRNYREFYKQGLAVENPAVIKDIECDAIVIANIFYGSANALYRELKQKYPGKKVYMLDENVVCSKETLHAFGLE